MTAGFSALVLPLQGVSRYSHRNSLVSSTSMAESDFLMTCPSHILMLAFLQAAY
jgi:hypothetical protein